MSNSLFKYLNISPVEERWGIYVTTVGYSKIDPKDYYPDQGHPQSHKLTWNRGRTLNDYYLVFIADGKGLFGSAITPCTEVSAGTCFFLFPEVWHRYKPDIQSGWKEYWVGFNGFYVEQLIKNRFFCAETPFVNVNFNVEMLVLFKKLMDTVIASPMGYQQQIAGITLQILGLANTIATSSVNDNDPVGKLIASAKFILQESFESSVNMEKLASQLPMGYSSFRKAFKKITGESPNQYHLNLRLNRAKDLLATTLLNINEVSEQTGFDSVFYFSKLFKKKNGISPNLYRKETV